MASPENAELTASEVFPAALAFLEKPVSEVLLVLKAHVDLLVLKVNGDQKDQEVYLVIS